MAKKAELLILETVTAKDILDFKEAFKIDIIQKGLDKPIVESIDELRTNLFSLVNEEIRVDSRTPGQAPPSKNGLGQPYFNPSNADAEILKHLTKGRTDLKKVNTANDFTTLNGAGAVFGHRSKGQSSANRVALRINIEDEDTVETQYEKAKQFFNESVIALPDSNGEIRYYSNPGIDLSQFLKIKCSTATGAGDEAYYGMSPAERFERDKSYTGERRYATWTLKQEGLDFVRSNFIDLTDTVELIKKGDYSRANAILNKEDPEGSLTRVSEQVTELEQGTQTGDIKAYTEITALINNLKVQKKVEKSTTIYSLVSDYNEAEVEKDVVQQLLIAIRAWVTANEDIWFKKLVAKVVNLIKQFEAKK